MSIGYAISLLEPRIDRPNRTRFYRYPTRIRRCSRTCWCVLPAATTWFVIEHGPVEKSVASTRCPTGERICIRPCELAFIGARCLGKLSGRHMVHLSTVFNALMTRAPAAILPLCWSAIRLGYRSQVGTRCAGYRNELSTNRSRRALLR